MRNNPDRRSFLRIAARAATGICAVPAVTKCRSDYSESRPSNIIIVLCDDLGYGDLACQGHPHILSPNIDRFAADGMTLTSCYAAAPVCSPSRAGMLTGRIPQRCGFYNWIAEGSPMHLRSSEITVASLLRSAGYQTCHIGKWHCNGKFNSPEQPQPDDHGFDYWFSTQNNAYPSHRNPENFVRNGTPVGPVQGYSSTVIVDEAVTWLKQVDRNRPFCLFVWFHSTHRPVATAEEFVKMYVEVGDNDKAVYYGNVTQLDYEFGRLLQALENMKLRDHTLILFTSDNGPQRMVNNPGSRYDYGSPGILRGMKSELYEGGIRVPGFIQWPGRIQAGQVCREAVNGTDVLPTLCDIAGIPIPNDRPIDGVSILPALSGKSLQRITPLYWQFNGADSDVKVAMRQGDWKLLAGLSQCDIPARPWNMGELTEAQLDCIANAELTFFELYNLGHDIRESRELSTQEPQQYREMVEQMRDLFKEIKTEGPTWPVWRRPPRQG